MKTLGVCFFCIVVFALIDYTEQGVSPAQLGDACGNNADCTAVITGSVECSTTCICSSGNIASGTTTCIAAPTQLGDTCVNNADCTAVISGSVECSSTTCSCSSGFTASGTTACVQNKASVMNAASFVTLLFPAFLWALRWTSLV